MLLWELSKVWVQNAYMPGLVFSFSPDLQTLGIPTPREPALTRNQLSCRVHCFSVPMFGTALSSNVWICFCFTDLQRPSKFMDTAQSGRNGPGIQCSVSDLKCFPFLFTQLVPSQPWDLNDPLSHQVPCNYSLPDHPIHFLPTLNCLPSALRYKAVSSKQNSSIVFTVVSPASGTGLDTLVGAQ